MKGKRESDTTLSDSMDCSPLDSSVHGIFQARVLEWGASAFSYSTLSLCKLGRNPTQCQVVYTVLDLKNALFCIPLSKESQHFFAFKWEAPGEKHQQMTWSVLPQGFRDSPHLFGQALSRDLLGLDL